MSAAIEKIEREFKNLSLTEQAEAFERLANIIYEDQEESPQFIAMLKRRVAEMDSGAVKGRDAFEFLDELESRHSR